MSWLTDLAGKAENLLNKIDQNAAVVLKDKNSLNEQLQDVIWKTTTSHNPQNFEPSTGSVPTRQISSPSPPQRSAPSGSASPLRKPSPSRSDTNHIKRNDDEDLLRFLNSSEPIQPALEELRGSPSGASVPSAGSSSPINMVDFPSGGHSRSHSQGGMSSMASSYVSSGRDDSPYQQGFKPVDGAESYSQEDEQNHISITDILAENNLLKNEIRCLNNELTLMHQRSKAAEKEVDVTGQELRSLKEVLSKNEELESHLQALQNQLSENQEKLSNLSAENKRLKDSYKSYQSQDSTLAEQLKKLEAEHKSLQQESNELHLQVFRLQANANDAVKQNERYRQQISDILNDAEQYRARATRVLQEKEKLIANLQGENCTEGQTNGSMAEQEIEQLREELRLLQQESASQSKLLQSVRNDLQVCELQQEEQRQKAETEIDRLQRRVQEERSHRLSAEEDCRFHLEELKSVRKDMNEQLEHLKACMHAKEAEISQLKQRAQMSNNTSPSRSESAELEARVRNLATALMQKQGALEALIAERNSLRLKLERVENQSLPATNVSSTNDGTVLNLNENATRMRVPTLLAENPEDTGVTRRVKRAYSSLDTLGIRVGTFLRRYPLARILVILYMVLLHFWVAIVLFSYSPEGYVSAGAVKTSPGGTPVQLNGQP